MPIAKNYTYYFIKFALACAIAALLFTGCEEPVESALVDVPLQIALPAGDFYSLYNPPRRDSKGGAEYRAFGDPGQQEVLNKPTNAYFFCVFELSDETKVVSFKKVLTPSDWVLKGINGDSCYVYVGRIYVAQTPSFGDRVSARVYAAASDTELSLKFNKGGTTPTAIDFEVENKCPSSEEEVLSIVYTVDDALQSHIQHIYSSPYNYKNDENVYYGTVMNFPTSAPYIHLMLYHVAAKVDVIWNVPPADRSDLRVTKVKAKNLFEGDAYLFKPTATTHAEFTSVTGYTPDDLAGDAAGTWWAGRSYFYTIPYQASDVENKFPVQVDFNIKNMEAGATYTNGLTFQKEHIGAEAFVPWIRGQITITEKITDNKSTTVDIE